MNTSSLTLHLLRKDLRRDWLWLGAYWLMALLLPPLLPIFGDDEGVGSILRIDAALLPFYGLAFLILARTIRLDSPERNLHFLSTRPVPWQSLLSGKILFIALFLLAPALILKIAAIWIAKIPVTGFDVLLLSFETLILTGAALAAVLVISLFARNLAAVFASIFLALMVAEWGPGFLNQIYYWKHGSVPDGGDSGFRLLVFCLIVLSTTALVVLRIFRRDPRTPTVCILVTGLACGVAAFETWPHALVVSFPDKPAAPMPPMPARIAFSIVNGNGHSRYQNGDSVGVTFDGDDWGDITETGVAHQARLDGVEPPYFATLVDYRAVATLKSGSTISCSYGDIHSHGDVGGYTYLCKLYLCGLPFPDNPPDYGQKDYFELFNYLPDRHVNDDLTGVTIKGVATFEISRLELLKTFPLERRATIEFPRRRLTIDNVTFQRSGIDVEFGIRAVTSALRPNSSPSDFFESLSPLVYNPAKGEFMEASSSSSGDGADSLYASYENQVTYGRDPSNEPDFLNHPDKPLAPDWNRDARISFFKSVPCGRISFPYEISNVDLDH